MKPGISSYTYTWAVGVPGSLPEKPLSAKGLISKARETGIGIVQVADNLPLENLTMNELADLSNYACENGISIEMGGRGIMPEHFLRCLQTAEHLKSPVLRMVIDSHGFEPDLQNIVSIIKEFIPELKLRKIRLAIENHDRLKAREFEKIILLTDPDWVGICLDSVNSMGAGEGFETVSEILIPYTINLHIKDFTIFRVPNKMGLIIEGRPAGKGILNIPELVSKLSETGRCGSAILEMWTSPEPTVEQTLKKEADWAIESIIYLKSIL